MPFLHTWTLAIEMQFYIFLPVLLLFIKREYLVAVFSVLTVGLFAYGTVQVMDNHKNEMYFSLLARTPEFFMGVLVSLITTKKKIDINADISTALSTIGLILLVFSAFFITKDSLFPGALAILPCLGVALLILFPSKLSNTILSSKPMVFIGEISYSLYLWHWAVMAFFRYYYNIVDFTILQMLIIVPLAISLSLFSYYFIEQSLRKVDTYAFWKRFSFLFAVNCIVAVVMVPLATRVMRDIPEKYVFSKALGLDSHGGEFKEIGQLGDSLSTNNRNLLIGDSHALTLKPFFDYLGKKNSFAVRTISTDSYPLIPNVSRISSIPNIAYKSYQNIVDYSNEEIKNSTLIFLIMNNNGQDFESPVLEFINSIRADQNIIIISDFPMFDCNPARKNRDYIKDATRDMTYPRKQYIATSSKLLEAIAQKNNAFFLDLSQSKVFDDAPFYNDTLMYYDGGHLNIYGSEKFAIEEEARFMELFREIYKDK